MEGGVMSVKYDRAREQQRGIRLSFGSQVAERLMFYESSC